MAAEAIVSTLLENLASIALDEIDKEVRCIINVHREVENISSNFRAIQAVLEDAERQQVEKQKAGVRDWLDKLKEISFDIENALDEWSTAISKSKLEKEELKVCSFIPSPSFCFNRGKLLCKTAHKIQELNERLDNIAKERERYGFKELNVEKPKREETTSLINVEEICGRLKDEERIVNMLLNEGRTEELGSALHMISIVGAGGIGKTTLAQLAFNNEKVKSHFVEKIWVCVSDPFDEMWIAKVILKSVCPVDEKDAVEKLDRLEDALQRLKNSIEGKKFFLVLDDVWTEQYGKWDRLKQSLSHGCPGSKILVTTRKENVAITMGCNTIFPMEQLSEEEGWSLFSQIAFFGRSNKDFEDLEEVGKKIARKCKGLPLALKTIGGLMRLKKTVKQWQLVLDSEIWELEVAEEGLFHPLMFSYYDLSSQLRQCFLYCAIFPKDHVIEKNKLIKLWMAHGFLKGTQRQDVEMVGEDYFNDLAMRSFFHDFEKDENGGIVKCKMHDIVHDFARFLTRGDCLIVERSSIEGFSFNGRARHVMLINTKSSAFSNCIYTAENLHTLLIDQTKNGWNPCYHDLVKLFDKLKCVRTLRCGFPQIVKYPKQIGKLMHLRHLDLSNNRQLEELPEAVCDLYNLLILDISGCWRLKSLPYRVGNLINLWHLQNEETFAVSFMPKMEKLTCLRILSLFLILGDGKGAALSDLGELNHLQGKLEINGLGNVRDEWEAKKAQLQNKEGLTSLSLMFGPTDRSQVSETSILVLKALTPPSDLERLEIWGFTNPTMWVWPNWIVSLAKLKNLELSYCDNVEHLPPLGKLPSLESLRLNWLKKVKKVGVEFLGIETPLFPCSWSVVAFPNLKSLEFLFMEEWEQWDYGIRGEEDLTIMPRLSSLTIYDCRELKALPDHILQNATLQSLNITRSPMISNCSERGRRWNPLRDIDLLEDVVEG
ncbi:hypothetical protein SLA2020_499770 [Shorea laevis]